MRARALILVAAVVLGGCATSYVYRPTTAAAPETGYLVARYGVPPDAPHGEVLVTSFGVTKMDVAPGKTIPMLHVRLGGTNTRGTVPWTLDAREQLATVAGRGPLPPRYANSESGGPVVTVPPGQNRVLDLYYALTPSEQGEKDLPFFEVTWKVHAGDRVVAERTPFQRAEAPVAQAPPPPAYFSMGLGWSPAWWYDPFWPYPAGVIGFPLVPRYVAPYRVIGPSPHLHAGGSWRGHPVGPPAGAWRGHPVGPPGGAWGGHPAAPPGGGWHGRR